MSRTEKDGGGLLATLFDTGEMTSQTADAMVAKIGGLHRMGRLGPEELAQVGQIPLRAAKRIESAISLGREVLMVSGPKGAPLRNSGDVYAYLLPRIGWPEEEEFWVLTLDIRQRPGTLSLVARGNTTEVNLTLAAVFKPIIRSASPRGICIHTHPSGDASPSDTDLTLTDRIMQSAVLLGVEVVDHIILGQGEYCSLADKGYM